MCQLPFPVGFVGEWRVCRVRAFTMSVPAFIDISEEDQVCSRAGGDARVGLGEALGCAGPSRGWTWREERLPAEPALGLRAAAHLARGSGDPGGGGAPSCAGVAPAGGPRAGPEAPLRFPGRRQCFFSLESLLTTQYCLTHWYRLPSPNAATSGIRGGRY